MKDLLRLRSRHSVVLGAGWTGVGYWGHLALSGVLILGLCAAAPPSSSSRHVFAQGQLYGYLDGHGTVVIRPRYSCAYSFSEDVAAVALPKKQGGWGFVDCLGRFVIEPRFSFLLGFQEGLAVAGQEGTSLRGFVDHQGNWVITPEYSDAWFFRDGFAEALKNGMLHILRPTGKVIYTTPRARLTYKKGSEGLKCVPDGDRWGYIDSGGSFVLAPSFEEAEPFSEGLAVVRRDGTCVFIDRQGRTVIDPMMALPLELRATDPYVEAHSFSGGISRFSADGEQGYINRSGKLVGGRTFEFARDFACGVGIACDQEGRWSIVTETGQLFGLGGVFKAKPPSDDRIPILTADGWGFADLQGKVVVETIYKNVEGFKNGLAYVTLDGKGWAFIDQKGHRVTDFSFSPLW